MHYFVKKSTINKFDSFSQAVYRRSRGRSSARTGGGSTPAPASGRCSWRQLGVAPRSFWFHRRFWKEYGRNRGYFGTPGLDAAHPEAEGKQDIGALGGYFQVRLIWGTCFSLHSSQFHNWLTGTCNVPSLPTTGTTESLTGHSSDMDWMEEMMSMEAMKPSFEVLVGIACQRERVERKGRGGVGQERRGSRSA